MKALLVIGFCLFAYLTTWAKETQKEQKVAIVVTKGIAKDISIVNNRVRYPKIVFIYRYKNQRIDQALNFITKDTEAKAA
ncbi:hypothetical protein [Flavobacterium sp. ASW18X]|uniref:hypothetical protein n=1 Tax=Flavobacterium sp. ASW18X TaxID=2572595 RepID=UPI0010AE9997|nr:hypothetical protein [Flavobacterium sp. ASW18X]TKD62413.1 hypothetical protein FBT53_09250 [Flavobacterium sp. ASW18X]